MLETSITEVLLVDSTVVVKVAYGVDKELSTDVRRRLLIAKREV